MIIFSWIVAIVAVVGVLGWVAEAFMDWSDD
jgi:hypothetical protein